MFNFRLSEGMFSILTLSLAITCLKSASVNSLPQCSGNLEQLTCENVRNTNSIRGIESKAFKRLVVINNLENVLTADEVLDEYADLESLDLSRCGTLVLNNKAFQNLRNLKTLNISTCDLETLSGLHPNALNKLINLDASWNLLPAIMSDLTSQLSSLEIANFSHNVIQSIDHNAFISSLKVLHLKHNQLITISLHNYTNLNILTLDNNKIEMLDKNCFASLCALEELHITGNRLKRIANGTFKKLRVLKVLKLSANNLEDLNPQAFIGLSRLAELYLNSNNLQNLADLQFQYLVRLKTLDISGNSLKVLRSSSFQGLTNLRKLHICRNALTVIEADTFANLDKLVFLDLSHNALSAITDDIFGSKTLPSLAKLKLTANKLKTISPLVFKSLPFLEYLSLNNNKLRSLDVRLFLPLKRLKTVYLNNNLLKTISAEVLEALNDVSELFLNNNRLSFISDSNATFAKLNKVYLEGNPWECPCFEDLTEWLDERQVEYVRPDSPYYRGEKPLCVVTPVDVCIKNLRLVQQHKIEEIYMDDQLAKASLNE